MTIPRYDEIQHPLLRYLASGAVVKKTDLEEPMVAHFGLNEAERAAEYSSKNGAIFYDRISWALSYLSMAGLLARPKRAHYQITELGKQFIDDSHGMRAEVDRRIGEREPVRQPTPTVSSLVNQSSALVDDTEPNGTPQEALYAAADSIRSSICEDILNTVLSKTPRAFEHLVAQLLHCMGYGGGLTGVITVTPYSNDGGIDGVIKEDILGLGKIHIQAKRYAFDSTIGREAIQNFVGALAVAQSHKGVFITTSSFSRAAIDYVRTLNGATTIVLIDGKQLANYIYDFGLGMQNEQTVVIKKLDGDFWDQLPDDASNSEIASL